MLHSLYKQTFKATSLCHILRFTNFQSPCQHPVGDFGWSGQVRDRRRDRIDLRRRGGESRRVFHPVGHGDGRGRQVGPLRRRSRLRRGLQYRAGLSNFRGANRRL